MLLARWTERVGARRHAIWGMAALFCLAMAPGMARAAAEEKRASIIVDANSGRTLHAHLADEPRYPASLTKMMTLYLVFEAIEQGRATFNTTIKVSARAASAPPSKVGLEEGDKIRVKEAILALITKSANDVAIAVAEHFGGSERQFAQVMTAKARALGMRRTTFRNASGLPNDEQVTTARDMIMLGLRLGDDFPQYYPLFATRSFEFRGKRYHNHNALLKSLPGTEGLKTGYIRASGFNVVTSVRRGRRHLVGAVLGAKSAPQRDGAMRGLISKAMVRASTSRTRRAAPVLVARPQIIDRPKVRAEPTITMVNVRSIPVDPPAGAAQPGARPVAVARPEGPAGTKRNAWETRSAPAPVLAQRVATERNAPLFDTRPQQATRQQWRAPREQNGDGAPGRAPSTLGDQAQRMAGGSRPLTQTSMNAGFGARQVPPPAVQAGGGIYEIQIGAYGSSHEAETAIAAARGRAAGLLDSYTPRTIKFSGAGGRTMFRSRFGGFDAGTASATCLKLRRRSVDCFVAKPQ